MKSNEDKEKEFNKRSDNEAIIHNAANSDYKYGFVTDIDMHIIPKGLNEDVVRYIEYLNNQHNSQVEQLNTQLQHFNQLFKDQPIPREKLLLTLPVDTLANATKHTTELIERYLRNGIEIVLDGFHPEKDGSCHRSLFFRHQDPLASAKCPRCKAAGRPGRASVRHGGNLADLEADRG